MQKTTMTEKLMRADPVFWQERQDRIDVMAVVVGVELAREDEQRQRYAASAKKDCRGCGKEFYHGSNRYCWSCRNRKGKR